MNRRNERQKGFTLIELLVVLIIIAVLAAVLVPALTGYLDDAREKKAVSEAQVCVTAATEWAAVQRTALISQAYQSNKPFADAYKAEGNTAKWSTTYEELNIAAPAVTGTLALAEGDGQYFLRPESAPDTDTTDETMKNTVKTAAGVDGKLERMQLNADGKVLYLLYTSAEGIPVAYTAAGTAKDPATTVPVATLPEDTIPPEPTEPDHSGDLVFCVKNEYTGKPVKGITFHLVDNTTGTQVSTSQTTDDKGMVYFDLDVSDWDNDCRSFTLYSETWPEGYQVVYPVTVQIIADANSRPFKNFKVQQQNNENHSTGKYKEGYPGKYKQEDTLDHLYTFYVRTVPTLELCVWDDDNGNYLNGVEFTLSNGTQSISITSGLSPTVLDVTQHTGDKLHPGRETKCLDMSQYGNYAKFLVDFTKVPEGYQFFDDCILEIGLRNQGENENQHNDQLYTQFSSENVDGRNPRTNIECKNDYINNKSIVTIHVKGGKKVNFYVYDGLDSEHTTQLPNVKLQLSKQGAGEIATFTTDKDGKPKGAENFTQTLSEGEYTLHLVSGTPSGYAPPADITFKVERVNGLLTLTGDAAYVDNSTSSVTMLVTKPDTMRFKLQIVDYNNGAKNNDPQWAGVNVRITGGALDTSFNDKREYAINSIADNEHTFDITSAKNDNVTVTIVEGTDSDNDYVSGKHNSTYAENFVRSKFQFKLNKNADGTFTLTPTKEKYALYGYIKGNTVYVYAYPKITLDYDCATYLQTTPTPLLEEGKLTVTKSDGSNAYTVTYKTAPDESFIQEWKMKGGHNHKVGIPLGDYELKNTKLYEWIIFEPYDDPWNFSIAQDPSGFPVVKDKNGQVINNKTVVAKYKYKTSS